MDESKRSKGLLGLIQKHRFFFFFFLFLTVYHVLIVNMLEAWKLSDFTYSILCVDFSFGFASKLLPGAVFNAIFGSNANITTATVFTICIIFLVFAGVSVLSEKFIMRIPDSQKASALMLVLLFLTGPYTFSIFTKMLGIIDTYWLVLMLLFFAFLEQKILRFIIPLIFIGAVMIHFSALVFFIPIVSIILLYRICVSDKKSDKISYAVIFAVSVCVTLIFFFILILNESQTVLPLEEFRGKLIQNGAENTRYFDYSFFHIIDEESFIPESVYEIDSPVKKFAQLFYYQIKITYNLFFEDVAHGVTTALTGILVLAPVLGLFIKTHGIALKNGRSPLRRFCAFLMIVQIPFVFILAMLFAISVDMTRYYTHLFMGAFICLLTVLYHEEDMREAFFKSFSQLRQSLGAKIYFLAYMLLTLMPD